MQIVHPTIKEPRFCRFFSFFVLLQQELTSIILAASPSSSGSMRKREKQKQLKSSVYSQWKSPGRELMILTSSLVADLFWWLRCCMLTITQFNHSLSALRSANLLAIISCQGLIVMKIDRWSTGETSSSIPLSNQTSPFNLCTYQYISIHIYIAILLVMSPPNFSQSSNLC